MPPGGWFVKSQAARPNRAWRIWPGLCRVLESSGHAAALFIVCPGTPQRAAWPHILGKRRAFPCRRPIHDGNKAPGGTLSFRWKQAEAPVRAADRGDPVSQRFSDQLIAVLPRLRRFARGLTGTATEADDLVQAAGAPGRAPDHQVQEAPRLH